MRYAISVPPHGEPAELVDAARAAERAGWDGVFLWDHLTQPRFPHMLDPWVLLGAVALATERVRLGPMVTPLARRRPWKVAKELVTLDRLSGGRVIFGAGVGAHDDEFAPFGDPGTARQRARALDEGLVVLDGLLRGDEVAHDGEVFTVHARLGPPGLQRPRPPIWIAATWPHRRPLARAARYDGVFALNGDAALTPEQVAGVRAAVGATADIMVEYDPAVSARELAEAGATWLVRQPPGPGDGWLTDFRREIEAGPPR